jgi:hypothetical protein
MDHESFNPAFSYIKTMENQKRKQVSIYLLIGLRYINFSIKHIWQMTHSS